MISTEFQAYARHSTGEYRYWQKIGEPQPSEAQAWGLVHLTGVTLYPENALSRRLFETSCEVSRITRVPVR